MSTSTATPTHRTTPPTLGHVHLEVSDLDRSIAFYRDLLDLEVTQRVGRFAFLSATDRHHELALQELATSDSSPPLAQTAGRPGLYHLAFEVGDADALREVAARARRLGVEPAAVDHGISWALYLHDPDGLGVEVYLDRRGTAGGAREWHGRSRPLDL